MLCIGNTAGWLVSLYTVGGDHRLLINVVAGIIGAMIAGSAVEHLVPWSGTISVMVAATVGAGILLTVVHVATQPHRPTDAGGRNSAPAP
jgi:uncharacterized membrane protein YeaQ/YmgE (transglycosylase-associated protein family)